ncbi:hypothetical protein QR685DRAFT_327322 [Neurospora intermedia]|uniref:DUF3824 domain-containing protein n=1 Tax=Neurospora intermedia TaxID=5142 RepID=A0ABR3D8X7_NEUIN
MASYDRYDQPARERSRSTRRYYREERRDDRDPRYTSGAADQYLNANHDLIPRPREDSDLSVEEIRRDFPPPGYSTRDMRRARSAEPGYYDDHDDPRARSGRDYVYDYDRREEKKKSRLGNKEQLIAALAGAAIAIGGKELYDRKEAKEHGSDIHRNVLASAAIGAAGAFAGYQGADFYTKHKEKKAPLVLRGRDGRLVYHNDDEVSAKDNKGHKNFLESALAAAGIGSTLKALAGGSSSRDDRSDTRSIRSRRSSRSRSRSRGGDPAKKIQKAAMASLIAGATEAFRVSKEPGGWKGEKAKRILTAAAGAATVDAAMKDDKAGSKLGLAESVIGGLLGNRVLNGSKKNIEEDEKTGRSRSRSRARSRSKGPGGGLAAIATAGLGTYAANKLSSRSRSRRRSTDSYDSRDGSRDRRHRSRSRSVVDSARKGLAKLGIGNGPDDYERDRHDRRHYDDYADSSRSGRRHRDYSDDERSRSGHSRSRSRGGGTVARRRDASRGSVSSSDLGDSDDDRKRTKKMRGKQMITTGLAAVATIHAAHNIYQSVEKHGVRKKAVREGELSPEEAKKLRQRAMLQDAASVGIAALGIKGAISEMKEAREVTHETHEWKKKKEERHQRRLERLRATANQANDFDGDGRGDIVDFGRRRADNWSSAAPPKATRLEDGPYYTDGNPYGAMPRNPSPLSGNSPGRR